MDFAGEMEDGSRFLFWFCSHIHIRLLLVIVFGVQGVSPWRTIPIGNVEVRLYQKYLNPPTN